VAVREDVSEVSEREISYPKEELDESRANEPEDVNVKLAGVNHVSALSVHQDEAVKLFKFDF